MSIYPDNSTIINFYDFYTEKTEYDTISVPVSLYYPTTDTYGFGVLDVKIYQK